MKDSFVNKHPVILSIVYTILLSLFAAIATIIAAVYEMTQIQTMLIQTGGFLLSIMLAVAIMVKSKNTLGEYGICFPQVENIQVVLAFAPLVLVEAITFIVGIDKDITPTYMIALLLLMVVVVINEEVYFRGLILKTLRVRGTRFAIIISSVLFGIAHLGSLTVGKGIGHTLLLVAFSALFAFICAEIVVLTGSIFIPILWHFVHNIVSSITAETSSGITLLIVSVQCIILLGYSVYLWKSVKQKLKVMI